MFRLMVGDLISPSYFVATAAVELGFFKQEGVDIELERTYGAHNGAEYLRDGKVDFFGVAAYAPTSAFPAWKGVKILCALSQYSYWFLAVRTDLNVKRGDLGALKGLRISSSMAAPVLGLRYLLAEAGIDLERDNVTIVPPPATIDGRWMGHAGAEAMKLGLADAYWGNGMRLAIGEKLGVAKLHLDLRRGDGPVGARWYSFAALITTERLIEKCPRSLRVLCARSSNPEGAQGRPVARHRDRGTSLSAGRDIADLWADSAGCAVLRRSDLSGGDRRLK